MIHKLELYRNQKTPMHNGNSRILMYKTHYDGLGHAIKENCSTSSSASSPKETADAPTGRQGAVKHFKIDRLCVEGEIMVPAKQSDC